MMNEQTTTRKPFLRRFFDPTRWAYGLFWSWNIIFLAFMVLGFAPRMLPDMMEAVRTEAIPSTFPIYAIVLTLIPVVVVVLGLTVLRKSPGKLFTLGYGVEGPLMMIIAVRFFLVREMIPVMAFIFTIAGLGVITLLWQLLDRNIDSRGKVLSVLRVIGLTLLLLVGLYVSLWVAFYAVPAVAAFGQAVIEVGGRFGEWIVDLWNGMQNLFTKELIWLPFAVLGFTLFVYSATLFVLLPIAVPALYLRAWWRGFKALSSRVGVPVAGGVVTVVLVFCATIFVLTNRQPQQRAFDLLSEPPATFEEAKELLAQQEVIRAGLLNAYLAPQRYLGSAGEVYHIHDFYEQALNMDDADALEVQRMYERLASPILYRPANPNPLTEAAWRSRRWENRAMRREPLEAAELYEQFFDRPIHKAERETVVRAVRSTWSIERAEAAWLAVDDREVYLAEQAVTVTEHGDWADLELYEVYRNQTALRQEVVYYFSLPESAVITGVWLGNSPDRAERFAYHIAPRGAAQATYRNEVRRGVDPALVEQIGPRQYRLRIFPILPLQMEWNPETKRSETTEAPPLHLWLTWRVPVIDGGWSLPNLAEKRNVFWDDETTRKINGVPMEADAEIWLPKSVAAAAAITPQPRRIDFEGGQSVVVQPVSTDAVEVPSVGSDFKLAVILDRSRSMAGRAVDVEAALAQLAQHVPPQSTDLYLTASAYRGEEASRVSATGFDAGQVVYFGGQNAAELLAQFDTLCGDDAYDALFVFTDDTGYGLSEGDTPVPIPSAPVWMVHLGGQFPLGYDDPTLEAIQASGGGVIGSVEEALLRLLAENSASEMADVFDGYEWLVVPTEMFSSLDLIDDEGFTAIAARQLILAEMRRHHGDLSELAILDSLHEIAVEQSIVTPYSSMIVLVNERQEKLLKELEGQDDRFEREFEDVGQTEGVITVTGVPEPEEWLLIGLVVAMLGWVILNRRRMSQVEQV